MNLGNKKLSIEDINDIYTDLKTTPNITDEMLKLLGYTIAKLDEMDKTIPDTHFLITGNLNLYNEMIKDGWIGDIRYTNYLTEKQTVLWDKDKHMLKTKKLKYTL